MELISILLRGISNLENQSDRNTTECWFVGADSVQVCQKHSTKVLSSDSHEQRKHQVALHTLHHGSPRIFGADTICPSCSSLIRYDGADDAIFCTR